MNSSAWTKRLGAAVAIGLLCMGLGVAWAQMPAATTNNPAQQIAATAPARGAAGAPMPGAHYQYMCQKDWPPRMYEAEVLKRLNELGQQGWHLLPPMLARAPGLSYSDVYCFERAY